MRPLSLASVLLLGAVVGHAGDTPPRKLHDDAAALRRGMTDALDALLRDDAPGVRSALDRIEAACRRAEPEERATLGDKTTTFDGAFHRQLDLARELAGRGNLEGLAPHFYGLIKGCRGCHLEAAGVSFSSPSDTGSPTPGNGSTPSR